MGPEERARPSALHMHFPAAAAGGKKSPRFRHGATLFPSSTGTSANDVSGLSRR